MRRSTRRTAPNRLPMPGSSRRRSKIGSIDAAARARAAEAARATVESLGGALERTLQSLEPYLMQLQLRGRAGHA